MRYSWTRLRISFSAKRTPSDIPRLVDLMAQFYAESDYPLDRPWAEESSRQLLASDERGGAWVARRFIEGSASRRIRTIAA